MTTSTRTRKTARETHGTCRLIPACSLPMAQALTAGEAMLTITPTNGEPTNYLVQRLTDNDGETVGYRLTRLAWRIVDREFHDIDVTAGFGRQCDCPDASFRNRECKHVRALRLALQQAGIEVAVPKRQTAPMPEIEFDNP